MSKQAKRYKASKNQRAGQELSDDELEAVAGGVGAGGTLAPEPQEAAAKNVSKASPVLLKACATGEHIKEATITV